MSMAAPSDEETRTIEVRLAHPHLYSVIELLLGYFAGLRHLLWRDLIIKNGSINELKKYFISPYRMTARQFNSLAKELSGKAQSIKEGKEEQRRGLEQRVKATETTIVKLERNRKDAQSKLKAITSYRRRMREVKENPKKAKKKPKMPANIRGQFTAQLINKCKKFAFLMHQKKRRLTILRHKLKKLDDLAPPSLCFGGKSYFKKQFNLEKADLASHEEWRENFELARSSSVFFLGSSDETAGNQTVQYEPLTKTLRLRLPNALIFAPFGTHLVFENVEFPEHLREEFFAALAQPKEGARKNQKTSSPLTYRLLRRVNPNTGKKAYYLQASFNVPAAEKVTQLARGAIGLDLNADHVAVSETDRHGNLVDHFIIPFDLAGRSQDQAKAVIGDISAVICTHALSSGKAVAIEELDFGAKKQALREEQPGYRAFLSAFAYGQFQEAVHSKARAQGVELLSINPAYTSLIGAYKYQGLDISSHEKAALAIARRAQRYSEGLKVFHGTLPTHAMMSERKEFELQPRHVWRFYSQHRTSIRSLLILPDKRPLLPYVRALSLAKRHPSLQKSLFETREERLAEALRCASG